MANRTKEQSSEYHRAYSERYPERVKANIERQKARKKQMYRDDPEYRASIKAAARATYRKYRDKINEARRVHNLSEEEKEKRRLYNRTLKRRRGIRDNIMQKTYGISLEQYEAMLAAQDNGCAICGGEHTPEDRWKSGLRNLRVDHDHKTGVVRGLLCYHCNIGLGHFRDDPELIAKALSYLKRN